MGINAVGAVPLYNDLISLVLSNVCPHVIELCLIRFKLCFLSCACGSTAGSSFPIFSLGSIGKHQHFFMVQIVIWPVCVFDVAKSLVLISITSIRASSMDHLTLKRNLKRLAFWVLITLMFTGIMRSSFGLYNVVSIHESSSGINFTVAHELTVDLLFDVALDVMSLDCFGLICFVSFADSYGLTVSSCWGPVSLNNQAFRTVLIM